MLGVIILFGIMALAIGYAIWESSPKYEITARITFIDGNNCAFVIEDFEQHIGYCQDQHVGNIVKVFQNNKGEWVVR